jgi:hypothetical protein
LQSDLTAGYDPGLFFSELIHRPCVECLHESEGANVKLLQQKKSSVVSREQNRFLMGPVCRPEAPPVRGRLPARVWVELALGLTSSALLALALFSPHWMERWFGLAPDAGDGSAEYGLALMWAAVSFLMFGLAGYTWKKQSRTSSIPLAVQR